MISPFRGTAQSQLWWAIPTSLIVGSVTFLISLGLNQSPLEKNIDENRYDGEVGKSLLRTDLLSLSAISVTMVSVGYLGARIFH